MSTLIWFVNLWYLRGLYLMFNNRVVNSLGWKVPQSRIELAAPEGLLHSLLTSCLILIRLYRSEGAGCGQGDMCPPIVCLMVNHSVMVGGGESKWEANEGSRKCIKGPLPLNGCYPVRLSSEPPLWRYDMPSTGAVSQHVQMWYVT